MNLNESIIKIRVELQNARLKKSGRNKFAGFDYFELADFLPKLNELMLEEKMNDRYYIKDELATLELQKGDEINTYTMPFVLFDTPTNRREDRDSGEVYEVKSMQDIQYLGALNTYYKRYLYLNAFGITDGEVIDSMDNDEVISKKKEVNKATVSQLNIINKLDSSIIEKICGKYKVNKIEEITIKQASEVISNMTNNNKEEN